jgi:DNA-binding XRE family transcriptional regulator
MSTTRERELLRTKALEAELERLRGVVRDALQAVREDAPRGTVIATLSRGVTDDTGEWSKESILTSMRDWNELYGEPPSMAQWSPTTLRDRGRPEEIENYLSGNWPSAGTVRNHFGSWLAGLTAAGFEPKPAGGAATPAVGERDLPEWTGWQLVHGFRSARGLTLGELARRAKVSYATVSQMESGAKQNPQVRVLIAVAQGLGVRPAALLDE